MTPAYCKAFHAASNRDPLGLKADNLPFHGTDIWTLYELSLAECERFAAGRCRSC